MTVMRILSVVLFVSVVAAPAPSAMEDEATFVGIVDYRSPEKVGKFPELQNGADGSKGTHYGDPADGCMKDEVR